MGKWMFISWKGEPIKRSWKKTSKNSILTKYIDFYMLWYLSKSLIGMPLNHTGLKRPYCAYPTISSKRIRFASLDFPENGVVEWT